MSYKHLGAEEEDHHNPNEEPEIIWERAEPILHLDEFVGQTMGGMLMFLNTFALMAPWIALWYWTKNEDNYWESLEIKLTCSGFFFVTITPWLIFIFFFIIMKFTVNKRLAVWSRLLTFHCMFWGVLIVIGSSVMMKEAWKVRCGAYRCNMLKYLSSGFGFFASIMLFVEAYFHYQIYGKHACRRQTKAQQYGYR